MERKTESLNLTDGVGRAADHALFANAQIFSISRLDGNMLIVDARRREYFFGGRTLALVVDVADLSSHGSMLGEDQRENRS